MPGDLLLRQKLSTLLGGLYPRWRLPSFSDSFWALRLGPRPQYAWQRPEPPAMPASDLPPELAWPPRPAAAVGETAGAVGEMAGAVGERDDGLVSTCLRVVARLRSRIDVLQADLDRLDVLLKLKAMGSPETDAPPGNDRGTAQRAKAAIPVLAEAVAMPARRQAAHRRRR